MQALPPKDRSQGKRLYRLDKASPITLAASMVRKKLSAHYYFTEFETNEPHSSPDLDEAHELGLSYNWHDMRADFTLTGDRPMSPEFYATFERVVRIVNLDARANLHAVGTSLFFTEEHHIHPTRGVLKKGPPPCPF